MWDKLADLAGKYLKKGSSVYLEGKLQTSSWEDKNGGGKKYKTEIVANQMQFLGGRNDNQGSQGGGFGEPAQNSYSQDSYSAPQQQQPQQSQAPEPVGGMDDELPF
jgi:single-strand DNA-binding protein